jgi:chromosome partitioning protein
MMDDDARTQSDAEETASPSHLPTPALTPGGPRPARAIALMNQKGGVGKTTTSVNLAAGVASLGRRTLLVDLDPQAHATLHLGVDPDEQERSVYDVLLDDEMDPRAALVNARENLDLFPAEVNLAAAETELASLPDRQQRLTRAFEALRGEHEFIFIDCPPSLGLLTLNALAAAGEVVVPMQAHFLALQGVGKLLETVRLVTQRINAPLLVSGVILCMHDENAKHTREVVADLEAFFDSARESETPWRRAQVYRPAIRRNIKLAECPSFGQTIFEYARWAPGALDYEALAKTFIEDWDGMLERARQAREGGGAPEPAEAGETPEIVTRVGAEAPDPADHRS